MRIFVGHSLHPDDRFILDELARFAPESGLEIVVAQRPWESQSAIPPAAAEAIESADAALFLLTADGPDQHYVTMEAGFIRNSIQAPIVILCGRNVRPSGTLQWRPFIDFMAVDARASLSMAWDFFNHDYDFKPSDTLRLKGLMAIIIGRLLIGEAENREAVMHEARRLAAGKLMAASKGSRR